VCLCLVVAGKKRPVKNLFSEGLFVDAGNLKFPIKKSMFNKIAIH